MENKNYLNNQDTKQIDQLHETLVNLSKNCFEIKKLCITVLVSASVLISTFTDKKLDWSIFLGAAIIILFFYILDVQSFYYQIKIRLRMTDLINDMNKRNEIDIISIGMGMPISKKRLKANRLYNSFINPSMLYYGLLFGLDFILSLLYALNLIGSYTVK